MDGGYVFHGTGGNSVTEVVKTFVLDANGVWREVQKTVTTYTEGSEPCQCQACRPREPYSRAMLERLLPAVGELPIADNAPINRPVGGE